MSLRQRICENGNSTLREFICDTTHLVFVDNHSAQHIEEINEAQYIEEVNTATFINEANQAVYIEEINQAQEVEEINQGDLVCQ